MSMRVLHVYRTYFPQTQGGLEEVIRQICLNTRRHGVESRVLCVSPSVAPRVVRRAEAVVYRAKLHVEVASCSVSLQMLPMYRRLLQWADIVHYHFPWPFADVLHFLAGVRVPTVLTYHSDIVRQRLLAQIYAPLRTRFFNAIDRIVCTSPNYFATSTVLQRFEKRVDVVPIGLDPKSYPPVAHGEVEAARAQFGEGFFLFVGVLRYYKCLHILLDAIQGAPYRVVIVGSGPTEAELKQQAADLGLTNVVFAGHVSDQDEGRADRTQPGRGVPVVHALRGVRRHAARGCHARQAVDFHGGRFGHESCQRGRRDRPGRHAGVREGASGGDGPASRTPGHGVPDGTRRPSPVRAPVQRRLDGRPVRGHLRGTD